MFLGPVYFAITCQLIILPPIVVPFQMDIDSDYITIQDNITLYE